SIPGTPPDLSHPPGGCRFAARCAYVTQRCRDTEPELGGLSRAHVFACWHPVEGPLDLSASFMEAEPALAAAALGEPEPGDPESGDPGTGEPEPGSAAVDDIEPAPAVLAVPGPVIPR